MGNFFIDNLLTQNHFLPACASASSTIVCLGWLCSMRRRDIWPIEERGFSSMASSALFAELSECLLNQLDGGRGIENFLLIQVDIFDAVLAAVGGGNLLFRDIDP